MPYENTLSRDLGHDVAFKVIIRRSNQKMKVVTNFPESYNSPGQFTSYIILVPEPPGGLRMRTRRLWGTPGTQDLNS